MTTDCEMLREIKLQAAGNLPLQKALVAGVVMEGGSLCGPWPRGDTGCAAGGFQIRYWLNPCDRYTAWQGHPITAKDAETPALAVAYAITGLNYKQNAAVFADPIEAAYRSERPAHYYSETQQALARRVLAEVFAGARMAIAKPPMREMILPERDHWRPRVIGVVPEAVVIHTTAGGSTLQVLYDYWISPGISAGTTFAIARDGEIGQFAPLDAAPYAHGVIQRPTAQLVFDNGWSLATGYNGAGYISPNDWGIGIELLDAGTPGNHTLAQLNSLRRLVPWIFDALILPHRERTGADVDRGHVIGHSEVDGVDRPFCPSWQPARFANLIAYTRGVLELDAPPAPPPPDDSARWVALALDADAITANAALLGTAAFNRDTFAARRIMDDIATALTNARERVA